MARLGCSMLYSLLLFIFVLSIQEMYRAKLASTELLTIMGGFSSSLLFLLLLTESFLYQLAGVFFTSLYFPLYNCSSVYFIGNFQESSSSRTGWGAVVLAEIVALVAASTVHRVCITTCFLFSMGLLYEINMLSGMMLGKTEVKAKQH